MKITNIWNQPYIPNQISYSEYRFSLSVHMAWNSHAVQKLEHSNTAYYIW